MASRSGSTSDSARESRSESAAARKSGGGMRVLTLLLALYGAGAGTMALMKAKPAGGGGGAPGGDSLDARFNAQASQLRTELKADLDRAVAKDKESVAMEAKRAAEARDAARVMKEAIEGRSEATKTAFEGRAEVIESRLEEEAKTLQERLATIDSTLAELKSRPIATGPAPVATAPVKPATPTATPPGAPAAPEPTGPTPEEIAKNKDKVRALIKELLEGFAANDVGRVFNAALKLGNLGDLEAVEPLMKVAKEFKDPYGRNACTTALGRLHACDAAQFLIDMFLEKDNSVVLQAAQSFSKIAGIDSGLSGDASRKDKNEAKDRAQKYWREHEEEIRAKWNQPKGGAAPPAAPAPAPDAPAPGAPAPGMDGEPKK